MHHKNPISRIIAAFMKSPFSHSGVIYDTSGRDVITMETTDYEVTANFFDRYLSEERCSIQVWREENLPISQRVEAALASKKLNLQTYGYFQLLSWAFEILMGKIGIKLPHLIRWGIICNHVPLYAYQNIEGSLISTKDPEAQHTEQMRQMLMQGATLVYERISY